MENTFNCTESFKVKYLTFLCLLACFNIMKLSRIAMQKI